jgi:hypothetical protein
MPIETMRSLSNSDASDDKAPAVPFAVSQLVFSRSLRRSHT